MVKKMSALSILALLSIGVANADVERTYTNNGAKISKHGKNKKNKVKRTYSNNGAKLGAEPSHAQMPQSPLDAEAIVLKTKTQVLRGLQSLDNLIATSSDTRQEMVEGLRAYVQSQRARVNPAHMNKVLPMQKMDYQKYYTELNSLVTDLSNLKKLRVRHDDAQFNNQLIALRKKLGGAGDIIKRKMSESELQAEILRQLKKMNTTFKSPEKDMRSIRDEIIEGSEAYVRQYIQNNPNASRTIKDIRKDLQNLESLAGRRDVKRFTQALNDLKAKLKKNSGSWF